MVGPISTEQRESKLRKIKVGTALLVGLSMGLVALQGDASLPVIVGAVAVGAVLGGALAWYVFPDADAYEGREDTRNFRR